MTMNRIQFQPGLSLPEFHRQFGSEDQCRTALEQARWPHGFRNKVPFVVAVSLDEQQPPIYLKHTPVAGFSQQAIIEWAKACLTLGAQVISGGLYYFAAVSEVGNTHQAYVAGDKKPKDLLVFH